jgi:hypothetical protein
LLAELKTLGLSTKQDFGAAASVTFVSLEAESAHQTITGTALQKFSLFPDQLCLHL